jgi:two-component system, OmpR family, alkaline phosphatase synthesis response regulator PhoP
MPHDERPVRLLLVEDEENLRSTLKLNFEMEGYVVVTAERGWEALERLRNARFDGVVLDVMLPDMDGFAVCETMRVEGDRTPVLFLTARSLPQDRVRGLRSGDDYVSKPFELEELLLRVAKLIRRPYAAAAGPDVRRFGANVVHLDAYTAECSDGRTIALSEREVRLLRLLMDRQGQVVSREDILEMVWGYDVFPSTRTVDNYLVAFRKYFEADPREPRHFHSVRGVGYKFTP